MKNTKKIFLTLTLIVLLLGVSTIVAADNDTIGSTDVVSDTTQTTTDDVSVVAEEVQTSSDDNCVETNTNKIEKEDKNIKTSTKTVEVSNFASFNATMMSAISDTENDEYIINLKENSEFYFDKSPKWYFNVDSRVKNITINGNGQTLTRKTTIRMLLNNTNILFKDLTINTAIRNYNGSITFENCNFNTAPYTYNEQIIQNYGEIIFKNSLLDTTIYNYDTGTLNISDDTTIGTNFILYSAMQGTIYIDDISRIIPSQTIENTIINEELTNTKNLTITNSTINAPITNNAMLTINNSTLNSTITNNQELNIADDCVFGENLLIRGQANYNNTTKIAPYITVISGTHVLENVTLQNGVQLKGNITLINCELNNTLIQNMGILTLNNCTIRQAEDIPWLSTAGSSITVINDNTTIVSGQISGSGEIFYGEAPEGFFDQATEYNGENTIENTTLVRPFTNNGLLTLINCSITKMIQNKGNLTLINCSLSNNDMKDTSSFYGFLIDNRENTTMITCIVENNTFNCTRDLQNLNGIGYFYGAISNKGNLVIDNCTFQNNTVGYKIHVNDGSYFGVDYIVGDASCIFNNGGNLTINDSLFKDNYAGNDAGAILSTNNYMSQNVLNSEASIYINNTRFINNTANSTDVALNITGRSNVFENSEFTDNYVSADNLTVDYCTINSELSVAGNLNMNSNNINSASINAKDITANDNTFSNGYLYVGGSAEIVNNIFTNQSGLSLQNAQQTVIIHDNSFVDNNYTYNTIRLAGGQGNAQIYDNTYIHTGLNDSLVWSIPPKVYVNDVFSATYSIGNPEYYDVDILDDLTFDIYVDDVLYATTDSLEDVVLNKSGEISLCIQPSISSQRFTQYLDVLRLQDIIITPENYDTYVVNGKLSRVNEDNRVLFEGEFDNKGEIIIETDDIVVDGRNAHFTNTTFTVISQNTVIQNLNIDNMETGYVIDNKGKNNYIVNNHINLTNTDGLTAAIKNTATKVQIKNNVLYVDGPAKTIDYETYGVSNTQAIFINGTSKNTVQNNTITVTTTQPSEIYGTIEAITAHIVTDTIITQNTIYASDAKFTYGINMLNSVTDNSITENNITVTSYRYCDGIQVGNQAESINITANNINIYCHNTTPVDEEAISYGIITTNMDNSGTSTEIDIYYNNITIDSTIGYGIEIYRTTETEIRFNNIIVNGSYSMGIGYAHSPSSHVVANYIRCIGDSTYNTGTVTEEIRPENVGIKIQQDSTNIKIDDGWIYGKDSIGRNTIHTYDKAGTDYAINVESTGAAIEHNSLRSTNKTGNQAIKNITEYYPYGASNGADNIYTHIEISTPTTVLVNQPTQINITIKDEYDQDLEFQIQDLNNPIYDEETGQTYYNYIKDNITLTLTIGDQTENITINENTATYTYTPTTTGKHNITATFQERIGYKIENGELQLIGIYNATTTTETFTVFTANLTLDPITASIGETATLTANIIITADDIISDTNINTGRVYFKINGKTLRDTTTGKILYADITDNTATTEYTVPKSWNENTTIEAIYTGGETLPQMTSQTVNPTITTPETQEPEFTVSEVTTSAGEEITITVTTKNLDNGKIVLKVNGKTVKADDGKLYAKVTADATTLTYTVPKTYKAGDYTIKAVYTAGATKLEADATLTVE